MMLRRENIEECERHVKISPLDVYDQFTNFKRVNLSTEWMLFIKKNISVTKP